MVVVAAPPAIVLGYKEIQLGGSHFTFNTGLNCAGSAIYFTLEPLEFQ